MIPLSATCSPSGRKEARKIFSVKYPLGDESFTQYACSTDCPSKRRCNLCCCNNFSPSDLSPSGIKVTRPSPRNECGIVLSLNFISWPMMFLSEVCKHYFLIYSGKDPHFKLLVVLSPKDKTKANNYQKRKGKIPTKCCFVAEKLIIAGHKHCPYAFKIH